MAIILPNPDNVPGKMTTGYQLQNTVLYASMTGFCNINLNGNNISAGSVFEVNGALFRCVNNEPVSGLSGISQSVFFYIYAEPVNDTQPLDVNKANVVQFYARTNTPAWNTKKGGYYINNNRALIKAIKHSNGDVEAVKMNSILTNVNSVVPPNSSDSGTSVVPNKNVRTHETYHGQAGWYRYEMRSGSGNGNGSLNGGGVPSESNIITGVFYHSGGTIIIHVGGDGYNGGDGGSQGSGGSAAKAGGGGSGAGEETYIISGSQKFSTERIKPGNGGGNGGFGILDETRDLYANDGTNTVYTAGKGEDGQSARGGNPCGGFGDEPGRTPGFGWGGGGAGGGYTISYPGANASHYSLGGGGGGAPGWLRPSGDSAAGYCKLFYIGL